MSLLVISKVVSEVKMVSISLNASAQMKDDITYFQGMTCHQSLTTLFVGF